MVEVVIAMLSPMQQKIKLLVEVKIDKLMPRKQKVECRIIRSGYMYDRMIITQANKVWTIGPMLVEQ